MGLGFLHFEVIKLLPYSVCSCLSRLGSLFGLRQLHLQLQHLLLGRVQLYLGVMEPLALLLCLRFGFPKASLQVPLVPIRGNQLQSQLCPRR